MASTSEPVISKNVGTALSWTPSGGECLKDGLRYVWYVEARKAEDETQKAEFIWSEGKVFEMSLFTEAEEVEATKEFLRSYLQTEWLDTESFEVVKEKIKEKIAGSGNITAEGQIGIIGYELSDNTLYSYQTGNSINDANKEGLLGYNTFFTMGFS